MNIFSIKSLLCINSRINRRHRRNDRPCRNVHGSPITPYNFRHTERNCASRLCIPNGLFRMKIARGHSQTQNRKTVLRETYFDICNTILSPSLLLSHLRVQRMVLLIRMFIFDNTVYETRCSSTGYELVYQMARTVLSSSWKNLQVHFTHITRYRTVIKNIGICVTKAFFRRDGHRKIRARLYGGWFVVVVVLRKK